MAPVVMRLLITCGLLAAGAVMGTLHGTDGLLFSLGAGLLSSVAFNFYDSLRMGPP